MFITIRKNDYKWEQVLNEAEQQCLASANKPSFVRFCASEVSKVTNVGDPVILGRSKQAEPSGS